MALLFRYECKKLFSRKILWISFALCLILMLWGNSSFFTQKRNGEISGMRDGYAAFEGRVATDALVAEAKEALNAYISAHPEEFESYDMEEEGGIVFFPIESGYAAGIWQAYNNISQTQTVEQSQERKQLFEQYLKDGYYEDGRPLTYSDRKYFEDSLACIEPTVVHYAEGWRQLTFYFQFCGYYILLLLLIGLSPLFTGESSSRMDSVLLCSARRKQAAIAKLMAAALYAFACAALIFGAQLLAVALTWGLYGASAPAAAANGWINSLAGESLGEVFLRIYMVALVSALAVAAVLALASSLLRHPLFSLMAGSALLAVQFLPMLATQGRYLWQLDYMDRPFWYRVFHVLMFLPAAALSRMDSLSGLLKTPSYLIAGLVLSTLIAAVSGFLSCRYFLKSRRS